MKKGDTILWDCAMLAVACGALLACGCDPAPEDALESDAGAAGRDTEDTAADAGVDPGADTDTPTEAFMRAAAGRYAHYDIVAYEASMGVMGLFKNLIISYGFTELVYDDGALVATDRFCHSEQKSNQNFTPIVPDELTRAIIPDSVEMEIRETGEGELHLWRPETPTLLGISYEDSYETPLPKKISKDDPRLVDADQDGKPGVTVYIEMLGKTEELYIARREIFAFEAYLQEDGSFEGLVHDRSEQLVIGATNPLLTGMQQEWLQHDDLTKSPIYLVPIDDDADCEELMARRDELFPPDPPVWK
jgi:hypothetical protein